MNAEPFFAFREMMYSLLDVLHLLTNTFERVFACDHSARDLYG